MSEKQSDKDSVRNSVDNSAQTDDSLSQLSSSISHHSTKWRVFCAVPLTEEVRERAAAHIELLRECNRQARASWDRPEKLHITMKFLGDVEASRVEKLSIAAE